MIRREEMPFAFPVFSKLLRAASGQIAFDFLEKNRMGAGRVRAVPVQVGGRGLRHGPGAP
jgi:hypothetical protein